MAKVDFDLSSYEGKGREFDIFGKKVFFHALKGKDMSLFEVKKGAGAEREMARMVVCHYLGITSEQYDELDLPLITAVAEAAFEINGFLDKKKDE